MHDGDVLVGQRLAGVQGCQLGIVPLGDLAQVHFGQHGAGHAQFAGLEAVQVHHRHSAADDGRKLHHAVFFQLSARQWGIGRAKRHGLGADLANTARGTDGLVVQAHAGFLLVGFRPLGIHRERERGAGAGDVCRKGVAHCQGGQCYCDGFEKYAFHEVPFGRG